MTTPKQLPQGHWRDADLPAYWRGLGLPGLADIHIHFLPPSVQVKVWNYFDHAETNYGRAWPINYRQGEAQRLEILRALGVRAIPSLTYAHKPGMAAWLNDWCADFARRVPDAVHSATFYPEQGVGDYVREALDVGARLFKVHVQVGAISPDDDLLEPAWGLVEDAQVPVVLHAGSAPRPGEYTGPEPVRHLLTRHPRLVLVIAHLGMDEYHAFADLAEQFEGVHLDTTMAGTDFVEQIAPLPRDYIPRLADLGHKVVLGTDFPQIPYEYAHQIQALDRLGFGEDWMRAVLWDNGARLMHPSLRT